MSKNVLAAVMSCLPVLTVACGTSQESELAGKKKAWVMYCNGTIYNEAIPFGERSDIIGEGKKQFEQISDFNVNNEAAEYRSVITALQSDCNAKAEKFKAPVAALGVCGTMNLYLPYPDLGYKRIGPASSPNDPTGQQYTGFWSCNVKEVDANAN